MTKSVKILTRLLCLFRDNGLRNTTDFVADDEDEEEWDSEEYEEYETGEEGEWEDSDQEEEEQKREKKTKGDKSKQVNNFNHACLYWHSKFFFRN